MKVVELLLLELVKVVVRNNKIDQVVESGEPVVVSFVLVVDLQFSSLVEAVVHI